MQPPLIAHVIFELAAGGLENGLINLINRMPADAYRHVIVCVKGTSAFERRLQRTDVAVVSLGKRPGINLLVYRDAWRVFRKLRPQIVHTRNLAALEMLAPAWLAGVPVRIHSEHGRDEKDIHGNYWRYNAIRKLFRPLVHRYLTMSQNLRSWLIGSIGIDACRVEQIYTGVDTERFVPRNGARPYIDSGEFLAGATFVVGAVGRMVPIKDHVTLVNAFALLLESQPDLRQRARLIIVGDGSEKAACEQLARSRGIEQQCWFAGQRSDIPELLRSMDVFCLTSLNEGINNTILEAMASGLPVVATAVGGNPELVIDGETGSLVPARSAEVLAIALGRYAQDRDLGARHGAGGRKRIEESFSLNSMVAGYLRLYDQSRSAFDGGRK